MTAPRTSDLFADDLAAADKAATVAKEKQLALDASTDELTKDQAEQRAKDHQLIDAAAVAQDRVRQAAAVLEKIRANANALERAAAAGRACTKPPKNDDHAATDDDVAYLEATTIASLHAQAAGVQNIKALVPIILDPMSAHYRKWRDYFLLTLGRYSLSDHVLSDAVFPHVPAWSKMDCVVLSWIFNSVSPELLEITNYRGHPTAQSVWLGIEKHFHGNSETCALRLDAEFWHLVQGDLSINDYYLKMKGMADALGDLSETVHDRTLVLNILRGLNERFQYMHDPYTAAEAVPLLRRCPQRPAP